jgi:hypothetical protein
MVWPALLQEMAGLATRGDRIWYKGRACVATMELAPSRCCHGATALLPWRGGVAAMALWPCYMELAWLLPWRCGIVRWSLLDCCHAAVAVLQARGGDGTRGLRWCYKGANEVAAKLNGGAAAPGTSRRRSPTMDVADGMGCPARRNDDASATTHSPATPTSGFSGDAHSRFLQRRARRVLCQWPWLTGGVTPTWGGGESGWGEHYVRGAVRLLLFESIFLEENDTCQHLDTGGKRGFHSTHLSRTKFDPRPMASSVPVHLKMWAREH